MKHRLLTSVIGVIILGTAILLWAWPGEEPQPIQPRTGKQVQVQQITAIDGGRTLRFPGVTRATRRAALSFVSPARLAVRMVEVGEHVAAGQVLAGLDERELRHGVTAAEAALAELQVRLAQAERDRSRATHLVQARAATAEELEQVSALADSLSAARAAARVRLQDARRLLDEAVLRAPYAGTVTAVLAEPGEWVVPGRPVIELSGAGDLEIELGVTESVVAGIDTGHEVRVELPFLSQQVTGRLTSVTRAAIGSGRLFPVVVSLPPTGRIGAGMTAEVLLEVAGDEELAVPLQAVLNPGASIPSVFCVRDGRAVQLPVELGRLQGPLVSVSAQLAPADLVVITGHTALADGDLVEVVVPEVVS